MKYPDELIELALLEIPTINVKPLGFLDIIGKQHDEVINTRLYCNFLSPNFNLEIAKLFIASLLNLVTKKTGKNINIQVGYTCSTEIETSKGNRIDLVINSTENKSAIIIENKIFTLLKNDLIDYWSNFNYPDENKIGIILTLKKISIPPEVKDMYINITHTEWITQIKDSGLPTGLTTNQYVYLNKNHDHLVL